MLASGLSSLKNITTGLRMPDATTVKATTESLAHSIQLLPTLGGTDSYHENGINLGAGSDLLQRYEGLLAQMHENQVTLAAQAETTDQRVRPVLERCNAQYRAINALYKELWTLPKVLEGLASFQQSLRAICDDIDNLEVLLAERNVEVEALELERWKITQQHKLEEYRQIKRGELQRLEKEMQAKKKHLEKELLKGEEREKMKLEEEERKYREACEAAFRHSMEEFKKYGPQAIPRAQVKESLEQISLGAVSDSDLEQFLGSDDEDDAEDLIGEDERWGHKWEADNEPEDAETNSENEKEEQEKKGSNDAEDTEEDKHPPSERPAAGEDDEQSTRQ